MVVKRTSSPWMDIAEFGSSLPEGLGLNLLVKDVAASVGFATHVLQAEEVYSDPDFAVLKQPTIKAMWILHADHSYGDHLLGKMVRSVQGRGTGAEFRLYGLDPDCCEARAREWGYIILQPSTDKPHGLRECFILDSDWYCWTPSIAKKG